MVVLGGCRLDAKANGLFGRRQLYLEAYLEAPGERAIAAVGEINLTKPA
jgi:hypothetical protein